MLTSKRIGSTAVAALTLTLGLAPATQATTRSDRPAGVVIFTTIEANSLIGRDTLVRLSNTKRTRTAGTEVTAKCFYINANSHCSNTGNPCSSSLDCITGVVIGSCVAGWNITDFLVKITHDQPLGWIASRGLSGAGFPITATGGTCRNAQQISCQDSLDCPTGGQRICDLSQNNAGSLVPPVAENPFMGELTCVEVDNSTLAPIPANDLTGQATIETIQAGGTIDTATYNAVGLINNGTLTDDNDLSIGTGLEYDSCPSILIIDHLFDAARDPINNINVATSDLTLIPCSADLTGANPGIGSATAQFLVFNEFEQRFSTSHRVDCFFKSQLSLIDTTQSNRSIWNAAVSGTVAGQTRVRALGSGLIGNARLQFTNLTDGAVSTAAYNIDQDKGDHDPDLIRLPAP